MDQFAKMTESVLMDTETKGSAMLNMGLRDPG